MLSILLNTLDVTHSLQTLGNWLYSSLIGMKGRSQEWLSHFPTVTQSVDDIDLSLLTSILLYKMRHFMTFKSIVYNIRNFINESKPKTLLYLFYQSLQLKKGRAVFHSIKFACSMMSHKKSMSLSYK